MTAFDDLKAALDDTMTKCEGIPISDALVRVRAATAKIVEKALKDKGLWETAKNRKPGEFFLVVQDRRDESKVCVHLRESLKRLLTT